MSSSRPSFPQSTYTFGDSDLAGQRLALLAQIFEEPSRRFLHRFRPAGAGAHAVPALAVDLACGPGHTTALVHDIIRPRQTVGIDNSEAHLRRARARPEIPGHPPHDGDISYLQHDLRLAPFPVGPADLVFARFILTHLAQPEGVLRAWSTLLAEDGILLLQESTRLECAHPAFTRYYGFVGELQRLHGQSLYIGRDLSQLVRSAGLTVMHADESRFERCGSDMAQLHVMNLRSWREDPQARANFDAAALDDLDRQLSAMACGTMRCPPVRVGLAEVAAVPERK